MCEQGNGKEKREAGGRKGREEVEGWGGRGEGGGGGEEKLPGMEWSPGGSPGVGDIHYINIYLEPAVKWKHIV